MAVKSIRIHALGNMNICTKCHDDIWPVADEMLQPSTTVCAVKQRGYTVQWLNLKLILQMSTKLQQCEEAGLFLHKAWWETTVM